MKLLKRWYRIGLGNNNGWKNEIGGIGMEKIYMVDEVENIKKFDTLEDAKEYVKK